MPIPRLLPCFLIIVTSMLWAFEKSSATLWQDIGIGVDWGPHWSASPSALDVRDTADDGAFPAELCLIRDAGFQTVRMYGETSQTWISLLDAAKDYNDPQGSLAAACHPGGTPAPGTDPVSVVYQVAICGPDPRTLKQNGDLPAGGIGDVKCYDPASTTAQESDFTSSVDGEVIKLGEVLRYQKDSFKDNVKLVLVGNEILFSRGTCEGDPGTSCTQNSDCSSNQCTIAHFCSDTLSQAMPTACTADSNCTAPARCTDVTNAKAIDYAFAQVESLLQQELGAGDVPPITISLQGNVLTAPSLGNTSLPLWSREQFVNSLPSQIVAVNIYPDQWGLVPDGSFPASDSTCMHATFSSCLDASNAVDGDKTKLPAACTQPASAYVNPLTDSLRNSVHDFYSTLTMYYPGFDVAIAETGWHTDGACLAYNDCKADPSRYSPGEAAKYYQSLYQYVTTNQIPLLAFELFDQKTKVCTPDGSAPPAEANYGIFENYCELKGALSSLLPSNGIYTPDLTGFDGFLDNGSCENQTVWTSAGTGNVGVCSNSPTTSCQNSTECGSGNRCVWGYCSDDQTKGCNPGDPNNPSGCGACLRAGNCYSSTASPAGYYAGKPLAACWLGQACPDVCPDFKGNFNQPCGCFVAMAPATHAGDFEGPGFTMRWSQGTVNLEKVVQPIASIVPDPAGDGFTVQPVWARGFVSNGSDVELVPESNNSNLYPTCENTVSAVTTGTSTQAEISWNDSWTTCTPPGNPVNDANRGLDVFVPRTFGGPLTLFPALLLGAPPSTDNAAAVAACKTADLIDALTADPATPAGASRPLSKAVNKLDRACEADNAKAVIRAVKKAVAFLERASRREAPVDFDIGRLIGNVRFATALKIEEAIAVAGPDDGKVKRAQKRFDKANSKRDPSRALRLFGAAYRIADRAVQ